MAEYKLIINLDATLAVQNPNGSFNYFKPSVGAEVLVGETDDTTLLNHKFRELYNDVIAPNFSAVVQEFILNIEDKDEDENEGEKGCNCENESCACKSLKIGVKPESSDDDLELDLPVKNSSEDLPKEDWE